MDIRISGSGEIAPGEYDAIHVSGSGRLHGPIRCSSLSCSGSAHGDGEIDVAERFSVSGSAHFGQDVSAGVLAVSGSGHFGQSVRAKELHASGSFSCGGALKCSAAEVRGAANVGGDVEGETVHVYGKLSCKGLVNAEEVTIRSSNPGGGDMQIGSIGGSRISILPKSDGDGTCNDVQIGCLFGWVKTIRRGGGKPCTVRVKDAIEGDSVTLDYVTAERVSGRVVTVGGHCEIALVQYSEQADISPDAKVGKVEKV